MNTTPQTLIDAVSNHLISAGIAGGNVNDEPDEFEIDYLGSDTEVCFVTMVSDRADDTAPFKVKSQIEISVEHVVARKVLNKTPRRELLNRSRLLLVTMLQLRHQGYIRKSLPALASMRATDHLIVVDQEQGWASIIRTFTINYVENVEETHD